MNPSQKCKTAGLESLAELAKISGEDKQKLIRWHEARPFLFDALIYFAVYKKRGEKMELKEEKREQLLSALKEQNKIIGELLEAGDFVKASVAIRQCEELFNEVRELL